MIRGVEQPFCEDKLKTWGSDWRRSGRKFHGELIVTFQYCTGAYKKDGADVLAGPVVTGEGVRVLN